MIGARVSIVVLTFDRRDEVLRTLANLADAAGGAPIFVVDNGSTDGTSDAIGARFPDVRVVRLPRNAGAAGRNAGVRACATPYVAFCDDDLWWLPGSLARAADVLDAHRSLAVVTARVLVGAAGREDPTNARMAASPLPNTLGVPGAELLGFLGGACMMRREAFLAAGGYEPRLFLGAEEPLLAADLAADGWRMAYLPDVLVRHDPSTRRDPAARSHLAARNALWYAWLRRPRASAWRATRRWWQALPAGAARRAGVLAALAGLPWILRTRRVVPPQVEAMLATLEAFYGGDGASAAPLPRHAARDATIAPRRSSP